MGLYTCKYKGNIQISEQGTTVFVIRKESYVEQGRRTRDSISKEVRLSVRIEHKVSDKYGRHKENDLSDVSSKHNAGVHTVIVTLALPYVVDLNNIHRYATLLGVDVMERFFIVIGVISIGVSVVVKGVMLLAILVVVAAGLLLACCSMHRGCRRCSAPRCP